MSTMHLSPQQPPHLQQENILSWLLIQRLPSPPILVVKCFFKKQNKTKQTCLEQPVLLAILFYMRVSTFHSVLVYILSA